MATQKQIKTQPKLKQIPVNLWNIEKTAVRILIWILRCGDKGRFSVMFNFKNGEILNLGNFFVRLGNSKSIMRALYNGFIAFDKWLIWCRLS